MERGTEAEASRPSDSEFKSSCLSKAVPDTKTATDQHIPSNETSPPPPDSHLQDMQRQLALSIAALVQNTVERETKELLQQIRDNSERQITLLKACLADSWRDPGQRAQLRAALSSEEPWKASDGRLVDIKLERKPKRSSLSHHIEWS